MKKNYKILFVLLWLVPTSLSSQTKMSKEEREQLAKTQLDNKQYENSIANYTILINGDSNNAYYFNQRGLSYYNLGNMKKAKENFSMATLYSDKEPTYWTNLSAVYNNLNDDKRSYETAIKALQYGKSQLTIYNAGSSANNYKMLQKGIEILTNVGEFYHNDQENLLASLYYKLEDYDKSIDHYEIFFKNYNPESSSVAFNILTEKRMYYFAMLAKCLEDVRQNKTFNKKDALENTFTELVNAKGYSYEEKFIESSAEWMRFIVKSDASYKIFFVKLANNIKDKTKQDNFLQLLEQ